MAAEALRQSDLIVEDLFCVVDREEEGSKPRRLRGLTLRHCSLLPSSGRYTQVRNGVLALSECKKSCAGSRAFGKVKRNGVYKGSSCDQVGFRG